MVQFPGSLVLVSDEVVDELHRPLICHLKYFEGVKFALHEWQRTLVGGCCTPNLKILSDRNLIL